MRSAEIKRATLETDIALSLNIDGTGKGNIQTGVGFLDHMLVLFSRHGRFDLDVVCKGDTVVDDHHSVEDIGIVLGAAFAKALGDKRGIRRYGSMLMPMDEALVLCAIDLSGRAYYVSDAEFAAPMIGDFDTEMVKEFFYAISYSAKMNLHILQMRGRNSHHIVEGTFKSFARTLRKAVKIDDEFKNEIPSTKGVL